MDLPAVYGLDLVALPVLVVLWAVAAVAAGCLSLARSAAGMARAAAVAGWAAGAAVAVTAVLLTQIAGELTWVIDPDKAWLHAALATVPAVVAVVWCVPRLVRVGRAARVASRPASLAASRPAFRAASRPAGPEADGSVTVATPPVSLRTSAADPVLSGPLSGAAVAAAVSLYAAVVPHERLTLATLGPPLVVLGAATALATLARRRRQRRVAAAGLRVWRERWFGAAVSGALVLAVTGALAVAAMTTSTVTGYDADAVAAVREQVATTPVRTGTVTTEGDELYFEVRGSGPPLLMIAGANGDAGFYTYPAVLLADEYEVITYDRRGNSRSTRHHPGEFDVAQQARDAVAVLRAAGHRSAAVVGNSGGAVIALELAARYPEAVTMVVAHEPPILSVLPDRARWFALFDTLDGLARTAGPDTAMSVFALTVGIPFQAYQSIPADFSARVAENQEFFVTAEMARFVRHRPDLAAIAAHGVPVTLAVGTTTRETNRFYGRPAAILAAQLPARLALFPGHHMSYFDLPGAWTDALRTELHAMRGQGG